MALSKKVIIYSQTDWKKELQELKQKKVLSGTQSEMLRYLIKRGLECIDKHNCNMPENEYGRISK